MTLDSWRARSKTVRIMVHPFLPDQNTPLVISRLSEWSRACEPCSDRVRSRARQRVFSKSNGRRIVRGFGREVDGSGAMKYGYST